MKKRFGTEVLRKIPSLIFTCKAKMCERKDEKNPFFCYTAQ
jgi:hypothetical protein